MRKAWTKKTGRKRLELKIHNDAHSLRLLGAIA